MDLKNNPQAYWAFQTGLLKEDVRDTLNSVFSRKLEMRGSDDHDLWNINLFRIEEFGKYSNALEASRDFKLIMGLNCSDYESPLLSPRDMEQSSFLAKKLLKEDSYLERFVKESERRNLNYIVQANYNGEIQDAPLNGSVSIMTDLIDTSVLLEPSLGQSQMEYFSSHIYGYFEDIEKKDFKIKDFRGTKIKL